MISENSHRYLLAVSVFIAASLISTPGFSWTDKTETLPDTNSLCKHEPEAQCTQAVRIGLQAPGIDWNRASLVQIRLDGANLQGANLSRAQLDLANMKGANLMLANMKGAHLHAVNLQDSNLTMANLSETNLLDADLRGANLRGANLQNAILIQANFSGATWSDGRVCAEKSIGECL